MVAVTFFGTNIFDSRICFFMKKRVTKNLNILNLHVTRVGQARGYLIILTESV